MNPLLEITDLRVEFATPAGVVRAVDGVSLRVDQGETLGLVGESGSGKSATALSILRLHDHAPRARVSGRILFEGRELQRISDEELREVRGGRIGLIFQEPLSALDPLFTIGEQIVETLLAHRALSRATARALSLELLAKAGLPDPERAAGMHAHQMSGGMRQRALIAMAIACGPALLVADEPTSALDVTVQAGILDLLRALQAESGMSLLFVTHDLAVVAENARRVAVMYAGRIVEQGLVSDVLRAPRHPYTVLLLRSRPSSAARTERLRPIGGGVESALDRPSGCRFRLRCPLARDRCVEIEPALERAGDDAGRDHRSACHFSAEASAL